MNRVNLDDTKAAEITIILREEEDTGISKTETIMTKYNCSSPYVTILRNNYRSNNKKVILKKRKAAVISKLRAEAKKNNQRYFSVGTNCKFCETDQRYTSTSTCVHCMKARSFRTNKGLSPARKAQTTENTELTMLPVYENNIRIEAGLNL